MNLLIWIFHSSDSHKFHSQIHKLVVKHFLDRLISTSPSQWDSLLVNVIVDVIVDAIKAVDDIAITIASKE